MRIQFAAHEMVDFPSNPIAINRSPFTGVECSVAPSELVTTPVCTMENAPGIGEGGELGGGVGDELGGELGGEDGLGDALEIAPLPVIAIIIAVTGCVSVVEL